MLPIPSWAQPYLLDRQCPYCNASHKPEWVCGIGIREIKKMGAKSIEKGNAALAFDYMCPECQRISTTLVDPDDINVSAEDMAGGIFETILTFQKKIKNRQSNKMSKSKISSKEIREIKAYLNDKKTSHEDFLKYIGVPQEQIVKYRKDDKDGKNK